MGAEYIVINWERKGKDYSVNIGVNKDVVKAAVLQRIDLGEEYYKKKKEAIEGSICKAASREVSKHLWQLLMPDGKAIDEGRMNLSISPQSCCYSSGRIGAEFLLRQECISEGELKAIANGVLGMERELYSEATGDLEQEVVQEQLVNAKNLAKAGARKEMDSALELAGRYAQKAGCDISVQREDIVKICYAVLLPIMLDKARESVGAGDLESMTSAISLAQAYARKTGQGISKQVEEIRESLKE